MNVVFWICAPLMVLGALGLVLFRKAVYSALSMALTMVNLAVLYASLDAPFLFAIQIIVYTGAILMLFLFVLMLVGVDTPDSIIETIKGQRVLSALGALGLLGLLVFSIGGAVTAPADTMEGATVAAGGNVEGVAQLLFGRYVWAFELTSALLITAAVGAMILAHAQRTRPKLGQRELADARMRAYATSGAHPGSLPNSGVFATSNSIATPALLPDGSIAQESVSATLTERGAQLDSAQLKELTAETFAGAQRVSDEEEEEL
ncbi:NADH-quinone oxidoreductase subunit J [Micropruina sonneratiae]|uniref:NADH-quinone oxidoreductase subunit J n=1 Tax=Micropruina sonneratiae TaxID=2986940 RepID=UPI0022270FDA|nr:NADH-quinone oxidoreductase subunit J [Micropruina sp. KQZ13P-5]MCW3158100.1 NADH-quinone oxidoreductase subunit J [Micropruina sp. KQZ13P-5]